MPYQRAFIQYRSKSVFYAVCLNSNPRGKEGWSDYELFLHSPALDYPKAGAASQAIVENKAAAAVTTETLLKITRLQPGL